jgi:hypothetical protein
MEAWKKYSIAAFVAMIFMVFTWAFLQSSNQDGSYSPFPTNSGATYNAPASNGGSSP